MKGLLLVFRDLNLVSNQTEKIGGTWDHYIQNKISLKWKTLNLHDLDFIGSKYT